MIKISKHQLEIVVRNTKELKHNYGSLAMGKTCAIGALAEALDYGENYTQKGVAMTLAELYLNPYEVTYLGLRELAHLNNAHAIIGSLNDVESREIALFIAENFIELVD